MRAAWPPSTVARSTAGMESWLNSAVFRALGTPLEKTTGWAPSGVGSEARRASTSDAAPPRLLRTVTALSSTRLTAMSSRWRRRFSRVRLQVITDSTTDSRAAPRAKLSVRRARRPRRRIGRETMATDGTSAPSPHHPTPAQERHGTAPPLPGRPTYGCSL